MSEPTATEAASGTFPSVSTTIDYLGTSRELFLPDNPLAGTVAIEVLGGTAYPAWPYLGTVRTILDIGANIGASALYFHALYPDARVFAFEPFIGAYELLSKNVNGLPEVTAFNIGLSDADGEAPLYLGKVDSVTNSFAASPFNTDTHVVAQLRDARMVMKELGLETLDVVKLDTEGSELTILRRLEPWIPKMGVLYLEYHHEDARREIDSMLAGTHILVAARVIRAHLGELCFVHRDRIPAAILEQAIPSR